MDENIHPSVQEILQYFEYQHLPCYLQEVSRPFCELAKKISIEFKGPEVTVGLRKLLEAKDCVVRAAVSTSRKAT